MGGGGSEPLGKVAEESFSLAWVDSPLLCEAQWQLRFSADDRDLRDLVSVSQSCQWVDRSCIRHPSRY